MSDTTNCAVCGGSVKVVGRTTMSYVNLDKAEIEKLKAEIKKLIREKHILIGKVAIMKVTLLRIDRVYFDEGEAIACLRKIDEVEE